MMSDPQRAKDSLIVLNSVLSDELPESEFLAFREARASTHSIKSRQIRFEYFCRALSGEFSR